MLVVRPKRSIHASGGDEVMYRHSLAYLKRELGTEPDLLELEPVGRARKLLALTHLPPEVTRYAGPQNIERLTRRLDESRYDGVLFFNESTFPALPAALGRGLRPVLVAHNVQSVVSGTDPSPLVRMSGIMARRFERTYYGDPAVEVVCISEGDRDGLLCAGVTRQDIHLAAPGAPAATPLALDAPILSEAVLTGSYGWWRKKRDLARIAAEPWPLAAPIGVTDPKALAMLGDRAVLLDGPDWSAGLRFGIVSDRFAGGFKLKSLEYVANNCVILSFCPMEREFEGLPHAEKFVRRIGSLAQAAQVIALFAEEPDGIVERFSAFKAACLDRYRWDRTLIGLGEAVRAGLAPSIREEPT